MSSKTSSGMSVETGNYGALATQLLAFGAGLGLLVPPLTSAFLGSVDKSQSGIAAGVLNSTRPTGSVIRVALLGTIAGQGNFVAGTREVLLISVAPLAGSALAAIATGDGSQS